MAPPDNTQETPYRAPCTKCTDLQAKLAKATAKKPAARYELYFPRDSDGDPVALFIARVAGVIGAIFAVITLAAGGGFGALIAWPLAPLLVAIHCVSVRKLAS